jgi:hypothetical protein
MRNTVSIVLIALTLTGCEKVVNLKYKDNQSRIIIDGNITNETGPYFIKITKSVNLSNTESNPTVDNAVVKISDDAGNSETLAPEGSGIYRTNTLIGVVGRTYTLTVLAENQTYTAQSTMPQQVPFDSIKIEKVVTSSETEYNLVPVYNDPTQKGNNYRFALLVNNKPVNQHFIQNDQLRNGEANSFRLEINGDDLKIKSADSIEITMQCIDQKVAAFYSTLVLMADSGPGGGTTPSNPQSNISNGAMGLFSAHTVQKNIKVVQ